ncbi:MAG: Phytochrome-like protein cph1 [Anaerolineales bacterium]|nr:Phytochrome-like protein cph1 [Anaerolineales bacterium]
MRSRFQLRSLAVQITVLVLAMLAVFTAALGLTVFQLTRDWLQESAVANLEALAAARQVAIKIQLDDYLDDAASFAHPWLVAEVEALLAAGEPERTVLHDALVARMRREQPAYLYNQSTEVVDLTGTVIAATDAMQEGRPLVDSPAFTEGQLNPYVADPVVESGKVYLDVSHPLRDAQGNTIAVLILRFDAHQLLAITGDRTGLGATGETVLGVRRGDEVHFLAPLRFDPNLSNIAPAPASGERAKPMIHATAGQSGVTHAPDYRGVQVIAAYRPIEATGWGVVVKQDEAETLAGVARLRATLLAGMGVLLLLGAVVTAPLTRAFLLPLRGLERATRRVAGGDLDTTVPVSQLDEVGQLAESFNTMVARLREAHDDLARSNKELASFAYVVSHDLKAPLRGIASLSEWLEEDLEGKLEQDQREQMQLLRERVQRMDALIDGLLEYSRVGRVRAPVVPVDVGALLVRVIDSVNPPDHIHVTVVPPMPALQTDELRLSQVFQNLIGNAVKYHPGPQGRVEVGCRDAGAVWEFSVSDDGLGIEPRHHERIFQMFQSLHSHSDVDSTGIGLALVKKIVEGRGGRIWVESDGEVGRGATFRFTWPKKE